MTTLYRLYNTETTNHLYTSDLNEVAHLRLTDNWQFEGAKLEVRPGSIVFLILKQAYIFLLVILSKLPTYATTFQHGMMKVLPLQPTAVQALQAINTKTDLSFIQPI